MIFNFMVTLFVKLLFITTTDMYTIQIKAVPMKKKLIFFSWAPDKSNKNEPTFNYHKTNLYYVLMPNNDLLQAHVHMQV